MGLFVVDNEGTLLSSIETALGNVQLFLDHQSNREEAKDVDFSLIERQVVYNLRCAISKVQEHGLS